MIEKKDMQIADVLWNYCAAVKGRWPIAWDAGGRGLILNKTNGFRALMRLLRDAYLYVAAIGAVPTVEQFINVFRRVEMQDDEFNTDNFKPGTSGEVALYKALKDKARI